MRTKESLKVEIRGLMTDYARAKAELSRETRAGRTIHIPRLLGVCHEILLSISHRQGLLVQVLETEIEYMPVKEAA